MLMAGQLVHSAAEWQAGSVTEQSAEPETAQPPGSTTRHQVETSTETMRRQAESSAVLVPGSMEAVMKVMVVRPAMVVTLVTVVKWLVEAMVVTLIVYRLVVKLMLLGS